MYQGRKPLEKAKTALDLEAKINQLASKSDLSLAYAFDELCTQLNQMPDKMLLAFAQSAHIYMKRALPSRDVIYYLRGQFSTSPLVRRTQLLFYQYRQISLQIQKKMSKKDVQLFFDEAAPILFDKGYYYSERWLTLSGSPVKKISGDSHFSIAIEQNTNLFIYYREVTTYFNDLLLAVHTIRLGKFVTVTSTQTGLRVGSKVLSAIANIIPVLGGIFNLGLQSATAVADSLITLKTQREAAKIARWTMSVEESSRLAESIAFQLTKLRENILISGFPFKNSVLGLTKEIWQQIREAVELEESQKWAIHDVNILINIMKEEKESKLTSLSMEKRITEQVDFLITQFRQQQEINFSHEIETSNVNHNVELLIADQPFKDNKTDLADKANIESTISAQSCWQQSRSDRLLTLAVFSIEQIFQEERNKQLAYWKAQQQTLALETELTKLFALQEDMFAGLSGLWRKNKEEIVELTTKLWAETGLRALSITANSNHWKSWSFHQPLLNLFQWLKEEKQISVLSKILSDYQIILVQWLSSLQKHDEQQKENLERKHQSQPIDMGKIEEWKLKLNKLLQDLGPDDVKAPLLLASGSAVKPADRGQYRKALYNSWKEGSLSSFNKYHAEYLKAWKEAVRQNRNTQVPLYRALVLSLKEAQIALQEIAESEQNKIQKENESFALACKSVEEERENLKKAIQSLEKFTESSTTLKPIDQEEKYFPEIKQETKESRFSLTSFWDKFSECIMDIEHKLGTAPCAFNVIAWNASAPGTEIGNWCWGLLLANENTQSNPYWDLLNRCISIHLGTSLFSLKFLGMNWPVLGKIITVSDSDPYLQRARVIVTGKSHFIEAQNLWSKYLGSFEKEVVAKNGGVPARKFIGMYTIKEIPKTHQPPTTRECHLASALLWPLLRAYAALDSYMGNYNELSKLNISKLSLPLIHPMFLEDLYAAIAWCEKRIQILEQAWLTQPPPDSSGPGYLLLTDIPKTSLEEQHPFYLTAHEEKIFNHHYFFTLTPLLQVFSDWDLSKPFALNVDPLQSFYEHLALLISKRQIIDDTELELTLKKLVDINLHREWLTLEHQLALSFDMIPDPEQRSTYVRLLKAALPDDHLLPSQLRKALNYAGWSLENHEERLRWDKEILPKLWVDEKPITLKSTESKSEEASPLLPSITIVRQFTIGGRLQWQKSTNPLKPEIVEKLFTPKGDWLPKKLPGNHQVYQLNLDEKTCIYAKKSPEIPANEFLVHGLSWRLGLKDTPMVELVKLHYGDKTFAVLLSEEVKGKNLKTVLEEKPQELEELDFVSFVATLIRVLLTNPEDDKPDDYFLVIKDGYLCLMRIDNERAFFEVCRTEMGTKLKSDVIQVKSIIYVFSQMRKHWPKDPGLNSFLEGFLHLQPIAVISDLLLEAKELHAGWNLLFSQEEVEAHCFSAPSDNNGFTEICLPLMCIPKGLAQELVTRLTLIQSQIRFSLDKRFGHHVLTGIELMKKVQPKLAIYYEAIHSLVNFLEQKNQKSVPVAELHRQVIDHFDQVVGAEYKKNDKGYISQVPGSLAVLQSLRLNIKLDQSMLQSIRDGNICSPKQELELFEKWKKDELTRVYHDLLEMRKMAISQFQGLPLRCQQELWEWMKEHLIQKTLTREQQIFLLQAMTGAPWPELDLQYFDSSIITKEVVVSLLQGTGKYLTVLNISGCCELPEIILRIIQEECPVLKHLCINRQSTWTKINIVNLSTLVTIECNYATDLVELNLGRLPALVSLECQYASHLTKITFEQLPLLTSLSLLGAGSLVFLENYGLGILRATAWPLPKLSFLDTRNCLSLRSVQIIVNKPQELQWFLEGCIALELPVISAFNQPILPWSLLTKFRGRSLFKLEGLFELAPQELEVWIRFLNVCPRFDSFSIHTIWNDMLSAALLAKKWRRTKKEMDVNRGVYIKCVMLGDGSRNKSYMATTFEPNHEYYKNPFLEDYCTELRVDNIKVNLAIFDTGGHQDYYGHEGRTYIYKSLHYPYADVFLLIFSVIATFHDIPCLPVQWMSEIQDYHDVPRILIGTEIDLRPTDGSTKLQFLSRNLRCITTQEGKEMAEKIGAMNYLEYSSLTQEDSKVVLEEAVRAGLAKQGYYERLLDEKPKFHTVSLFSHMHLRSEPVVTTPQIQHEKKKLLPTVDTHLEKQKRFLKRGLTRILDHQDQPHPPYIEKYRCYLLEEFFLEISKAQNWDRYLEILERGKNRFTKPFANDEQSKELSTKFVQYLTEEIAFCFSNSSSSSLSSASSNSSNSSLSNSNFPFLDKKERKYSGHSNINPGSSLIPSTWESKDFSQLQMPSRLPSLDLREQKLKVTQSSTGATASAGFNETVYSYAETMLQQSDIDLEQQKPFKLSIDFSDEKHKKSHGLLESFSVSKSEIKETVMGSLQDDEKDKNGKEDINITNPNEFDLNFPVSQAFLNQPSPDRFGFSSSSSTSSSSSLFHFSLTCSSAINQGSTKSLSAVTGVRDGIFAQWLEYAMMLRDQEDKELLQTLALSLREQKTQMPSGLYMEMQKTQNHRSDELVLQRAINDSLKEDGQLSIVPRVQKLISEAKKHGLVNQKVGGRGNCLYEAVWDQLQERHVELSEHKDKIHHYRDLRTVVCAHIIDDLVRGYQSIYRDFLAEDANAYIMKLITDGTWGGELELRALSRIFKMIIVVINSDGINSRGQSSPDIYKPLGASDGMPIITLGYERPVHYQSLRDGSLPDEPLRLALFEQARAVEADTQPLTQLDMRPQLLLIPAKGGYGLSAYSNSSCNGSIDSSFVEAKPESRTGLSGVSALKKSTLLEDKTVLSLTAMISRFKQKLASLCEDNHYKFTLERSSRSKLLIRIVADKVMGENSRKMKSQLEPAVDLLHKMIISANITSQQFKTEVDLDMGSLTISAESVVLNQIIGLLQEAGSIYFSCNVSHVKAALFYNDNKIEMQSQQGISTSPSVENDNRKESIITCAMQ